MDSAENGKDPIEVDMQAYPAIADHFRLQFEKAQDSWVLLFPEGMIKLNSSAAEILQRCDGIRTVNEIIVDLETTFNETGLEKDVVSFFQISTERGWIQFV